MYHSTKHIIYVTFGYLLLRRTKLTYFTSAREYHINFLKCFFFFPSIRRLFSEFICKLSAIISDALGQIVPFSSTQLQADTLARARAIYHWVPRSILEVAFLSWRQIEPVTCQQLIGYLKHT